MVLQRILRFSIQQAPSARILLVQGVQVWEGKALESMVSWKYLIIAMDNWSLKHLYDTIINFMATTNY